jgi:type I restriction enzyme S subunit
MAGEWEEMVFSEAFKINPHCQLKRGDTYPFVEMAAVNTGVIDYVSERKYAGGGSKFQVGDTLFARITPCLENGKIAPVPVLPANDRGHGSTEFIVIRGREGISDNTFAYYTALSHYVREYAIQHMSGTSGRQRVPVDVFDHLTITLPPLPIQRRIAHILGTLDDKIEHNRRMNATLEGMARALFKSWFVDFDPVRAKADGRAPAGMSAELAARFPDSFEDSPLGKVPRGWGVVALPEAVDINPSRQLVKADPAPYLDMQNMPTEGHRPEHWIERPFGSGTKFINGDTLLARITPCLENGKTAFVDFLHEEQVGWGSTEYIILRPKPPMPVEYGYYLARSEDLRLYAIQNMTGSSGRQRVPAGCFAAYPVVVPPEPVARHFGATVQPLMAKISANSEQSRTLAALRDALLPKLLSGAVGVGAEGIITQEDL